MKDNNTVFLSSNVWIIALCFRLFLQYLATEVSGLQKIKYTQNLYALFIHLGFKSTEIEKHLQKANYIYDPVDDSLFFFKIRYCKHL